MDREIPKEVRDKERKTFSFIILESRGKDKSAKRDKK